MRPSVKILLTNSVSYTDRMNPSIKLFNGIVVLYSSNNHSSVDAKQEILIYNKSHYHSLYLVYFFKKKRLKYVIFFINFMSWFWNALLFLKSSCNDQRWLPGLSTSHTCSYQTLYANKSLQLLKIIYSIKLTSGRSTKKKVG